MSIQPILQAQLKKHTLPITKLSEFLHGKEYYHSMRAYLDSSPVGDYTPNLYNKSRLQLIKDAYKFFPMVINNNRRERSKTVHPHIPMLYTILVCPHQLPGLAHTAMFLKYIELMGTEQHIKTYVDKSRAYQIVGCYAQTEIGHGSDIRGLQTTATFDEKTQQWILDSPRLSSAKYWPGQLSFFANYAMVFAQTIVKGKNHGVNPFVVQIKDKDYNWLPGIQGGDIGPKIGFHAKQNGFMLLHNIRVPKDNLLSKYVQVTNSGELKILGDPRIGYGTMMHVRELISCLLPKTYAQVILIAARYSFYRKQFRDSKKQEISIIDYQAQQDKVVSRIAEYYAICVAGNRIRLISERNSANVLANDFSLLEETHSNLSFSKSLFSQIVQEGIEICRRSLGGHGTSYYSGVPQLMNQYAANNTHEGQNTVMYLQSAKYVLKSYINLLKGKPLSDSVLYLAKFSQEANTRFDGDKPWTVHETRTLLIKSIDYLLTVITQRLANKQPGQSKEEIINYKIGLRLQQLAQLHGVHYIVDSFITALQRQQNWNVSDLLKDLCLLFAINQIHRLAQPIVEAAVTSHIKFSQLQIQKEAILKRLRPQIAGLVESFGIPDKYVRSELISGHLYQNLLKRARECELNAQITNSQRIVSNIKDVLAQKPRL